MNAPQEASSGARGRAPLAGLALLLALASCGSTPVHDGVEVDVLEGHRHSAYCGHYYHDFAWYFVKDHHHGEGCGHVYRYGRWTLE